MCIQHEETCLLMSEQNRRSLYDVHPAPQNSVRVTFVRYMIVGKYSTRYAKYQNMLANIGHRVGHQSGLDESSGEFRPLFCMEWRSASI